MSEAISKKKIHQPKIELFKDQDVGVQKTKIMPLVGSQVLREQILKIREQENNSLNESQPPKQEPDQVSNTELNEDNSMFNSNFPFIRM